MVIPFCMGPQAWAQGDYPQKPITFLIPYPTGSLSDLTGRALCQGAEKSLKQPLVVINKVGGGSSVALGQLAQSKPDGYTIGLIPPAGTMFMPQVEKVPYDVLKDFTYIMNAFTFNYSLIVKTDAPWKNFKEFIDYAKKNPKAVKYGIPGPYQTGYVVMEAVSKQLGIQWDGVPFKSDTESLTALLGGHLTVAISNAMYATHVRAGSLRILALMGPARSPYFPDAPIMKELGFPDLVAEAFVGVGGPRGLPQPILRKLEAAFTQATKDSGYLEVLKKLGLQDDYKNSKDFTKFMAEAYKRSGEYLRTLKLDFSQQ